MSQFYSTFPPQSAGLCQPPQVWAGGQARPAAVRCGKWPWVRCHCIPVPDLYCRGYSECCPLVVDPSTLLALLSGIALATFFRRQVILATTFVPPGKKKRDTSSMDSGWQPLAWILSCLESYEPDLSDGGLTELIGSIDMNEEVLEESEVESSCVVDTWRCASRLLEGGVRHLTRPGGVRG